MMHDAEFFIDGCHNGKTIRRTNMPAMIEDWLRSLTDRNPAHKGEHNAVRVSMVVETTEGLTIEWRCETRD